MFTGIIETVGRVARAVSRTGSRRLEFESDLPLAELAVGDSVAIDGVCLTVTGHSGRRFFADAVRETLDRTTLGGLRSGAAVNLERALRLGDRLGGHLVQGHVDDVARVAGVRRQGDDYRLGLELPRELARFVASKGSIAVQGVSLTVAARDAGAFEIAVIPETLRRTTLGALRAGDRVNLEVDLLARYLETLLQDVSPGRDRIEDAPGRRAHNSRGDRQDGTRQARRSVRYGR